METRSKVFCQARTRSINDDTAGVTTQTPLDKGHGYPIKEGKIGKLLVHPEECMVEAVEELGDSILVDKFLHADSQFLTVTDLTSLVKHTHDEFLVAGRGNHRAIHVLFTLL